MGLTKISGWDAKNSHGKITITGIDKKGEQIKVTRIVSIQASRHGPLVVRDTGEHFRLA